MNDLTSSINKNDVSAVKSLLAGGSVGVNARVADLRNGTVLSLAAMLGHVEIVALLLDAGARINDVDDSRNTPCHLAVHHGHTAVVELLVDRKANVSLRNRYSESPIDIAIAKKSDRIVMLLIDAAMATGTRLDNNTLCVAATVSADVVRLLVFKHHIDLSAIRDKDYRTLLHQALWRGSDSSVLDVLIEVAGVDIDARDEYGQTATTTACLTRNAGAIARFIAAGANLDLADNNGDTALHWSRYASADQFVCMLLAAGAKVHARNNLGRTACHVACERALVALPALMAFGANLDEPDNDGVTPRQRLKTAPPTSEDIEAARRRVFSVQLSFVRKRAFEVCVGLQPLGLDALCMCEILLHSCGPVAPLIAFHRWWKIATTVKHFRRSNIEN